MVFAGLREATPHSGHGIFYTFPYFPRVPAWLQAVFQKGTGLTCHLCVTLQPLSSEAVEMLLVGCVQAALMSPLCPWHGGES